jgi:hypothetical protein
LFRPLGLQSRIFPPLAGEVAARKRVAGGGNLSAHFGDGLCGGTPTPVLPRKRERERSRYFGNRPFSFSASLTLSLKPPGITMSPGF